MDKKITPKIIFVPLQKKGIVFYSTKDNFTEIKIKIAKDRLPIIALDKLLEGCNADVVFLQDNHFDPRIRAALNYTAAKGLRALGYSHYLIEASPARQQLLDTLGHGKTVHLYEVSYIGLNHLETGVLQMQFIA